MAVVGYRGRGGNLRSSVPGCSTGGACGAGFADGVGAVEFPADVVCELGDYG